MSVRAYKIITKEVSSQPSFNLWRDEDLIDLLKSQGEYSERLSDESGGTLEFSVASIKYALKHYKWEKEDYRKIQLEEDIKDLTDDEWIEYECY
jgi:hypothetical protein